MELVSSKVELIKHCTCCLQPSRNLREESIKIKGKLVKKLLCSRCAEFRGKGPVNSIGKRNERGMNNEATSL